MAHKFTAPLSPNEAGLPPETYDDGSIGSDGYRLIALVHIYTSLRLDKWQAELLIRVLERCPPGHARAGQLRYRQVVISIPRQAGKSVLASVLALYGLIQHSPTPQVLGVASNASQAAIVYKYTKKYVDGSPELRSILNARGTAHIGIGKRDGSGGYRVLAGTNEALQGYPSTLAVVDELHIVKPDVYDPIVTSQRAQTDPLLVGITTAGDVNSILLKRLYETGDMAIAGQRETFGFFCWYAEDASKLTLEAIEQANPAVACGRISAQTIMDDEKDSPPSNWKRFALNVFVEGLAEPWVPVEAWAACAGKGLTDFSDCIYSIEVSEAERYATITASKKIDGIIYQTLVCRLVDAKLDKMKEWMLRLRAAGRSTFVMDGFKGTAALAAWAEEKRMNVIKTGRRRSEAANMAYAAIVRHEVNHDNQPLVNAHHATARTKNQGDSFVIVPNAGSQIDAAYSSAYGIYAAQIQRERSLGIA